MIRDAWVVVRKEWSGLWRQDAGKLSSLARVGALALLGLTFGQVFSQGFGDSRVMPLLAAFLAAMFILPAVTDSFAGERENHTLETLLATRISDRGLLLGKIAATTAYGWGIAMAVTTLGVLIVAIRGTDVSWVGLAASVATSLVAAIITTCVGVLISLECSTVKQASQAMGMTLIGVTAVPLLLLRSVPQEWLDAMPVTAPTSLTPRIAALGLLQAFIVALVLLGITASRFQRERLTDSER